jgi:cellulose synthase/poly-beta-1,6-N-acetylglucosamine synthase-like glycosyltransferase
VAGVLPPRPVESGRTLPSVTLMLPAYNEEPGIERTLEALDRLEYPSELLSIVLIDDHSEDRTGARLERWAADRSGALALRLERRLGRAGALNQGIAAAPSSRVVAVCDADVHPRADWLERLVEPFGDDSVGAVSGYLSPDNARSGPVARYAAVESWVHQLVTSAGKDRLDLNPPTLGAAAYRRDALEQVGGFSPGMSGDDVRATVALTRAGWRTRFARDAVADYRVVSTWRDYWRQHIRWAQDLFSAGRDTPSSQKVRPAARLETWMLASGYADRVALIVAGGLAVGGYLPLWIPVAYLGVTAVEVVAAIARAGATRQLPPLFASTAALFALDVVASVVAASAQILGWPRRSDEESLRGIEQRLAGQPHRVDTR